MKGLLYNHEKSRSVSLYRSNSICIYYWHVNIHYHRTQPVVVPFLCLLCHSILSNGPFVE